MRREISLLMARPKLHRGCTKGSTGSHARRSWVCAVFIMMRVWKEEKRSRREREALKVKVKSEFERWKRFIYKEKEGGYL